MDQAAFVFNRHSGKSRNPFIMVFAFVFSFDSDSRDEADIYGGVRIFPGRERERPGEGPKTKAKMDSGKPSFPGPVEKAIIARNSPLPHPE